MRFDRSAIIARRMGAAPDWAGHAPNDFAVTIGEFFRCAVEIVVKVVQVRGQGCAVGLGQCAPVVVPACRARGNGKIVRARMFLSVWRGQGQGIDAPMSSGACGFG